MRIVRLSDLRRRRHRAASDLDEAIERALELHDLGTDFGAELMAAEALLRALEPIDAPPEALVALRAGLAARRAEARGRKLRVSWQMAPGAAAAVLAGLVAFVGLSGHAKTGGQDPSLQNAARTLQDINRQIDRVQAVADAHDPSQTVSQANTARQALVQATQLASTLPSDDPVRDLLLQTAELKIAQLEALLARLNLPPVAPLPLPGNTGTAPSSGASGPAIAAPPTTTTSSTTSSTSSTTTSTAPPGGVVTASPPSGGHGSGSGTGYTATGVAGPAGSGSSSGTSTTTSSTSTTTSSTTTTAPPPPSTTTTTAPPPP